MAYFLGIDTSTTSSKALLIDERGEVIADFVRRVSGGDEKNSLQPEAFGCRLRGAQVAGVNRVEGSAKKRDVQRGVSPTRSGLPRLPASALPQARAAGFVRASPRRPASILPSLRR